MTGNPYHYEAHFSPEEFAQLLHIVLAYQHENAPYSDMRLHAALSAANVAKGAFEGGKALPPNVAPVGAAAVSHLFTGYDEVCASCDLGRDFHPTLRTTAP